MPDIFHTLNIKSTPAKVFKGITAAEGLDEWWTKTSEVNPCLNGLYKLHFDVGYNWEAIVTKYKINEEFELQITAADDEWLNTKAGFVLTANNNSTVLNFYHRGWETITDNYKYSSYCWAMYLRILKRYLEFNEHVAYEKRLSVKVIIHPIIN